MILTLLAAAVLVTAGSLAAGLRVRARVARKPASGTTPVVADFPGRWLSLGRALLRPDRWITGLGLWLMVLDTALALAAPWPMRLVVDYGLGGRPFPGWLSWLTGLRPVALAGAAAAAGLLVLAAGAAAGYLVTFLTGVLSERMTVRLRAGLIGHILQLPPHIATAYPLGELTSRVGADARQVTDTVAAVADTVVPDLALLSGMTVITAMLDWRLTLVVLCLVPLYALTARLRNRALREAQQRARARSGELAALAADQLARLPAAHVFDQGPAELASHVLTAGQAADAAVAALDASAKYRPVHDVLPGLGLAAALVLGTVEVSTGRLTIGGLLVFVAYLSSLTAPVRSLAGLSTALTRGSASRDRIAELLRLPVLQPHPAGPSATRAVMARPRAAASRGLAIRLERVSYEHRPGELVLDNVSLDVCPGELTCLTGPSGAGKSTLLSLLIRLADPQAGRILVSNRDISELPLSELRLLITLVPQDPWLHTGTIAQNIGYGRSGATRSQITAAADRAGVTAFASKLARGYDTPMGEHGLLFSGGQRRRIAVARALLRDTPVLLLDEPTAGLDLATETRLIADMLAGTADKTVLLVTHQPRLADLANHVIRLEGGRVESVQPTSRRADAAPPNTTSDQRAYHAQVISERLVPT